MFRNGKCTSIEHSYKLFEYFQNKGIDSNNTLQKRQNKNGSIKEELFLSRGSKKIYYTHREKKEGTSI